MIRENAPALPGIALRRGWQRWLGWAAPKAARTVTELSALAFAGEARTLGRLRPGDSGVVTRVDGSGPIHQRLLELGVTPGARVEVIRFAPLGDPIEVRIRGYHLSLRRREAEAIWVEREVGSRGDFDTPIAERCGAGGQPEQR